MTNHDPTVDALVERLREVPRGAGHSEPVRGRNGEPAHRVTPYGNMMNEAADLIERLSAALRTQASDDGRDGVRDDIKGIINNHVAHCMRLGSVLHPGPAADAILALRSDGRASA